MSRGRQPTKLRATSTALSNWSSWKHLEFSVLCKWKALSELKGPSRGPGTLFCVLKTFHVSFPYKVQLPKEIIPTSTVQNTRMTIHNKLSCFFFSFSNIIVQTWEYSYSNRLAEWFLLSENLLTKGLFYLVTTNLCSTFRMPTDTDAFSSYSDHSPSERSMSTNFAPDVWKPTTHHNEKWFVKTDEKSPQFQLSPAQRQTVTEETLLQNQCKTTSSYPSLSHNEL